MINLNGKIRYFYRIYMSVVVVISSTSVASFNPIYVVSLVELITGGENYVNQRVEVFGFLDSGISLSIYLTEDHAISSDAVSSILVFDTDEGEIGGSDCVSSYVKITGTLIEYENNVFGLEAVE